MSAPSSGVSHDDEAAKPDAAALSPRVNLADALAMPSAELGSTSTPNAWTRPYQAGLDPGLIAGRFQVSQSYSFFLSYAAQWQPRIYPKTPDRT